MAPGRIAIRSGWLEAENVDWEHHVISYARRKTGSIAIMRMDEDMEEILRDLPGNGPLFPYLRSVRSGDRATEFKQRCAGLGIKGVTLHSYRYAWAERAKTAGYPERFAQVNLGHNSKAIHAGVFAQGAGGNAVVERIRAATEGHHWKPEHRTSGTSRCRIRRTSCNLGKSKHSNWKRRD